MPSTIFTPQNPSPRNEVRDLNLNQDITATMDGVKFTDYQIEFFKVSDNTPMHDTTKLPLSPNLADGELLIHELIGGTIPNTGIDSYKWKMTVWNTAEEVTTREFQFSAKTTPVLTFNPPATITTQSYEFTATVAQAEGDIVNNYTFELYDALSELIEDSGLVTNFNIKYTFEGFTNGDSLQIRVFGTTTGGSTFDSGLVAFNVAYAEPDIDLVPEAVVDNNTSLITVTRPEVVQIIGTSSGSISYVNDFIYVGNTALSIDDSLSYVSFDVDILTTDTIKVKWQPDSDLFEGKIVQLDDGDYEVFYVSGRFGWTINGITNYGVPISLTDRVFYIVLLPTKVEVVYQAI
jgi:hypothetical protein